jgi:hypothetical protein
MAPLTGLSWFWIAIEATAVPAAALLLAVPLWRRGQSTFGSIVGSVVIFGAALGLILREYAVLDILLQQCLDNGEVCFPTPSAFTRFALYAFIGLIEVFSLFSLGLVVDERIRRRGYAPEWQR